MEEQQKQEARYTPPNVIKKGKLFHIPYIRWFEAIFFSGLTGFLIFLIPFVTKVKVIFIAVLCGALVFIFLRGIENRSVCTVFREAISDIRERKLYTLGMVNEADKKKSEFKKSSFENESIVDSLISRFKERFNKFDEKYGN